MFASQMTLLRSLFCFAVISLMVYVAGLSQALADMRVCNQTKNQVGVAMGYKDNKGWRSEGWWNIQPDECAILLVGPLQSQYFYLYGVNYSEGGQWSGDVYMCTRAKTFTIYGVDNCLVRGFERVGFFEIDTGNQKDWTVKLTETDQSN